MKPLKQWDFSSIGLVLKSKYLVDQGIRETLLHQLPIQKDKLRSSIQLVSGRSREDLKPVTELLTIRAFFLID